jgi:membrane glycosyltransferase
LNAPSLSSPAGLQANATLNGRRFAVLSVNLVTWALLLAWFGSLLSAGGWTWVDRILFVCFVFGTPWSVLGFWNAVIGLWLLAGGKSRLADAAPFLAAADRTDRLAIRTAVLMTLRNEDPSRAIVRLKTVKASLDATGEGAAFSYFILSDTSRDDVAAAELAIIESWRAVDPDGARIIYRRRTDNTGFKAGNVRDFCARWGHDYELMLPLDADSLMTGDAIVRLVRIAGASAHRY